MFQKGKIASIFAILYVLLSSACKKDEVAGDTIGNNNSPYYEGIPTVLVQNYVNRLFIDLIGREPLDAEMNDEVQKLKDSKYSLETRVALIQKLQEDESFIEGDSSYKAAYFNRLYELFKVKMLEGASDKDINYERGLVYSRLKRDSISGDWYSLALNWQSIHKLDAVLAIDEDYSQGLIEINEVFARLLFNDVYDRINMNTFNFVNASFNDLFDRFPSTMEFNSAYDIVESDIPGFIFGEAASNKGEYIEVLVNSKEFYEGLIRWTYGTLMTREPNSDELEKAMKTFYADHDLPLLQRSILVTDEYANFN